MKRFYFICITVLFFAFSTHAVLASPFLTTNLNDRYILSENSTVRVEKSLVFTNKLSDHSIESYTMFFSNQSVPKNIEVKEDGLEASYTTRREDNLLAIVIPFKHPVQGIGKEKKLFVSYDLNGLVNNQQGYKELVIPVDPKNTEYEQYTIEVVAPGDFPALGLSKPRVNTVGDHSYQWTNVQTVQEQSVYIAFGSQALYTVELHYALKNEDGVPHRYEIPFIPDGAYQKVYIEHIDPVPEKTRIDEDDNILGSYIVESHSVKNITFRSTVALNSILRPELQTYFREKYKKKGLGRYLSQENYWSLQQSLGEFKTAKDIYTYVVDTLSYDTSRINGDLHRMGATWIVRNPDRAVCMEYTDLFVALARESGIGAREVIGYGVTGGDTSLPLSFLGDILHAWPEYYDTAREIWHPVDPTWGDTSGVDYYSSLDLNHIALVYHGTSALYPLPPGVYKLKQDTKDVYVNSTTVSPQEIRTLKVMGDKQQFVAGKENVVQFELSSESNTSLYGVNVELKDERGKTVSTKQIALLVPFQALTMHMSIHPPSSTVWHSGTYSVHVDGKSVGTIEYKTYNSAVAFIIRYWYIVSAIVFIGVITISSTKKAK